ncbi:MAG: ParM/StbA family protein [Peptostreptococcaceae bacterium]|nr:ParM/StbA family protein [Peptostreptococcaceae bacterium]
MRVTFDNGKSNCKYIIDGRRYVVPSKLEEGLSTFSEETFMYKDVPYTIGDEAEDYNYDFTKNNLHHKLMIYYCLAKHASYQENYDIIIGCPLSTYFNKEEQNRYIRNIINNGDYINIMYKDIRKVFRINSITIAPESIGGYINDFSLSKKQIRGVVDIGGLNVNCGVYDKGRPVKNKMFTLNLGIHILIKNIQQAILREKEILLNEYMCKHYLNNLEEASITIKEIIIKECTKFIESIKKNLIKNDWEIEQLNMVFIGGGSILLENFINASFNSPHIEKDIFANCEAFKKFGEKKNE